MMKSLFFLIFIFFSIQVLFSQNRGGDAESSSSSSTGKTHAVIIGISGYKNLPAANQLNFADDDALLLKEYLSKFADINLKMFLNDQATNKDAIGAEIYNLLYKEAQAGDEVIIYFAGHGDVDEVEDGFLLLNQVEPPEVATYDFNDALPLSKIQKYVNLAASNRGINVTFIADACHSGSVKKGAANTKISELYNDKAVTITSCQKDQVSKESQNWGGGHGVFTYYLVQGLMGMADVEGDLANNDGKVTLDELEAYVKSRVIKGTERAQTPVFFGGTTSKEMATVNADLLQVVKSNEGLTLKGLSSFGKSKALGNDNLGLSPACETLIQLLQDRSIEHKFFADELDSLDKLPLVIGDAQSKKNHSGQVSAITVNSNGSLTATGGPEGIALYGGSDLKNPIWLKGHSGAVTALHFSKFSGNLISGGSDNKLILWDASKKQQINSISISSPATCILQISADEIVVGTQKGAIAIWNLALNSVKEYKQHKGQINAITYHNQLIVSAGADAKLLTFSNLTKKKSTPFEYLGTPISSILQKGNGENILVINEEGILQDWNIDARKKNSEMKTGISGANSFLIDPFEKFAFVGAAKQKRLAVIDLSMWQVINQKTANTSGISALVYDPVYQQIKIGELDGSVTVQSIKTQPENSSALEIYQTLNDCGDLSSIQHKIDGTVVVGLNTEVNKVLNPLVNGAPNQPSLVMVQKALRYARQAFLIGGSYELDAEQLELNVTLLEIYEIILEGRVNEYDSALEKIKRIEELDPKGAYVFNVSAQLYALLNDKQKALEMAAKAEKIAPNWAETGINTGRILSQTGDKKAAEAKFKEVIQKAPTQSKGYTALGQLYLEQGKLEEAKAQLEKAIKIDSGANSVTKVYQETMSQIELIKSRGGDIKYPAPLNVAFYRNHNNVLKLSSTDYTTYKITAKNASVKTDANTGVRTLRVSGPVSTVTITLTSTTTGKAIGTYDIPVKDVPKIDLYFGSVATGESVGGIQYYLSTKDYDAAKPQLVYGYSTRLDPDLDNSAFRVNNFVIDFIGTGKKFTVQGSTIPHEAYNEAIRCQRQGEKGGIKVFANVVNKYGEAFLIEGSYHY